MTGGNYFTTHGTAFDASRMPVLGHEGRDVIVTPLVERGLGGRQEPVLRDHRHPARRRGRPARNPPRAKSGARRFDLAPTAQDAAAGLAAAARHRGRAGPAGPDAQARRDEDARNFQIYAGPKFYSRLDRLGHDEEKVMDFGKFKIVSIVLLALMNTFKSWLGNYGLAIILLTLLVKGVLFPLQNKANKSMKRMSALQPKMAELREKYKDDPRADQHRDDEALQGARRQPARGLPAHAHPDADLLRLPVHALHGGGTAQRRISCGCTTFRSRTPWRISSATTSTSCRCS